MVDLKTHFFGVDNNARTQVTEDVNDSENFIDVSDPTLFSVGMICTLSDTQYIQNATKTERVRITSVNPSSVTATRDIDGSGSQEFDNGSWIQNANNAEPIAQLQDNTDSGWTYKSVADYSYSAATTIATASDKTGEISVGCKIKIVTGGGTFYFIVMDIDATTITVWGGTDYSVPNAAFIEFAVSRDYVPLGFNVSPEKWTIEDTTFYNATSLSASTYYTIAQISLPTAGSWIIWCHFNRIYRASSSTSARVAWEAQIATATDGSAPIDKLPLRPTSDEGVNNSSRFATHAAVAIGRYTNSSPQTIYVIYRVIAPVETFDLTDRVSNISAIPTHI